MFLHLGADAVVKLSDVIAILDWRSSQGSQIVSEYMARGRARGLVADVSEGDPKSLVITTDSVLLSPISVATLERRASQPAPEGWAG